MRMKAEQGPTVRARALAVFGIWLAGFCGLLAALAGLLAVVAFSDANYSCPGMQCSDAIGSGILYSIVFALCAALIALGLWLSRRGRPG